MKAKNKSENKSKTKSNLLRKKIVTYYLNCTVIMLFILEPVEYLFDDEKFEGAEQVEPKTLVMVVIGLLLMVGIYYLGAYVFYRLTKKALDEESERRVKEQNLLYAAIAHDLKTPMTSVQGFAKALHDGKIKEEERQEIYEIIYRKSESMNDLINTLFSYSKLGTEEYPLNKEKINICTLVRDVVAECYCELEEHGIETEIDIPEEAIELEADRVELRRAVTNLVNNCYKHNPDGIRLLVSVTKENKKAVISVADSGTEIPAGMNVFEAFVTENTARTIGKGSGLGLAITKRTVERHGGEITVSKGIKGYTKAFVIKLKL